MDPFIARGLLLVLVGLGMLLVLSACGTIGKGRSTLVMASNASGSGYEGSEFEELIRTSDAQVLRALGTGKALNEKAWQALVKDRFGIDIAGQENTAVPVPATVSISVRDRSKTPRFDGFNIDSESSQEITTLLLDKNIGVAEKNKLLAGIRNNFAMRPEVERRIIFDRYQKHTESEIEGKTDGNNKAKDPEAGLVGLYRYFVELEIDIAGTLLSPDPTTRFEYMASAIRIPKEVQAKFINFSPKEADLYDLTIGSLKTASNLAANAKKSRTTGSTFSEADESVKDVSSSNSTSTSGVTDFGLSFSLNEELTREIKTSLESRSAGIHDDGKLFLIELRGTDFKPIAGTYSFKVMIEIKSDPRINNGYGTSIPRSNSLDLETRSVGVVRHITKRGQTGTFKKVPEPLNDHAFHQAFVQDQQFDDVWSFIGAPRGSKILEQQSADNLIVLSGYDAANFLIVDKADENEVLGFGNGKKSSFRLDPGTDFKVVFFPFVDGTLLEYVAGKEGGKIPESGSKTIYGNYKVTRTFNSSKN